MTDTKKNTKTKQPKPTKAMRELAARFSEIEETMRTREIAKSV